MVDMKDWNEIFENINSDTSLKAVSILNEKGILTDEDLGFMTKLAYKKGQEEFVKHMKKNGATSEYAFTCVFIPTNGEVCAIYDIDKFDLFSSRTYLMENYKGE